MAWQGKGREMIHDEKSNVSSRTGFHCLQNMAYLNGDLSFLTSFALCYSCISIAKFLLFSLHWLCLSSDRSIHLCERSHLQYHCLMSCNLRNGLQKQESLSNFYICFAFFFFLISFLFLMMVMRSNKFQQVFGLKRI